eukprot:4235520-Prymnesium_polylepis.1
MRMPKWAVNGLHSTAHTLPPARVLAREDSTLMCFETWVQARRGAGRWRRTRPSWSRCGVIAAFNTVLSLSLIHISEPTRRS